MIFSVIVPVYNVEKYLNECINSILSQDFLDYELILVNDGSTDNSGNICDEYAKKDDRIKTIHKKNGGSSSARNVGTNIAQGEYIVYLDSDDYICDNSFLTKLAQKTRFGVDIIFYGYKKYFEHEKVWGKDICQYPLLKDKEPSKALSSLLETDMYDGSAWNKAVRREFLLQNGIMFEPGMISEDSEWFLNVIVSAKTYDAVNEAFIVYRQREGSISHAPKLKSLTDNLLMLEKWSNRLKEKNFAIDFRDVLSSVLSRYYVNMLILYTRFPNNQVEKYFKRVKSLKFLLKYSLTKRAITVRRFCSIFGLRITLMFLCVLNKLRGKS